MSSPLKQNTTTIQELLNKINSLPEEVILPELTNPADASKALSGYEFINGDGEKVTGSIPTKTASDLTASGATVTVPAGYYASQTTKSVTTATQATPSISIDSAGKITATATQTAGYVSAGTKTGTKQLTTQAAKTITPSTSSQTAVASGVYTTGAVTVAAIPTVTQATPTISVDSAGKITATATQTAGYVSAGTKTGTKQLTTQSAKTITPSTSAQTAVAKGVYTTGAVTVGAIPSTYVKPTATKAATTYTPTTSNQTIAAGTYCSGAQTIKGDVNLVAENIKSGVSIFGVAGTLEEGGGGGDTFIVKNSTGVTCIIGSTYLYDSEEATFPLMIMNIGGMPVINIVVMLADFSSTGTDQDFSSLSMYLKIGAYTSADFKISYIENIQTSVAYLFEFDDIPELGMTSHVTPGCTVELIMK